MDTFANNVNTSRLREGAMTSTDLVDACFDRIRSREDVVGAWVHLAEDAARAQAKVRDRERLAGLLRGVPVGIKDIFDTADMPTGYGSDIYSGHRPQRDAESVALIRAAGGVILGKTVTTEFALHTAGKTTNPWDPQRTPGGSSSGSAAAVAAGMVPLAVGTQTGGSLIRPAAYCGVLGFKPTYGLIARAGVLSVSESLDTVGVFARNSSDAALLVAVLSARPEFAEAEPSGPPRIGLCRTPFWSSAKQESRDAVLAAAERLRGHGASVDEVVLPSFFGDLNETVTTIVKFEAARALAQEHYDHAQRLGPSVRKFLEEGYACPPKLYDAAQAIASHARRTWRDMFVDFDVLLTPSSHGEAPKGRTESGEPIFNSLWTLLRGPCMHLPTSRGPTGLPVGVQLVGNPGDDASFIATAQWVEAALAASHTV